MDSRQKKHLCFLLSNKRWAIDKYFHFYVFQLNTRLNILFVHIFRSSFILDFNANSAKPKDIFSTIFIQGSGFRWKPLILRVKFCNPLNIPQAPLHIFKQFFHCMFSLFNKSYNILTNTNAVVQFYISLQHNDSTTGNIPLHVRHLNPI